MRHLRLFLPALSLVVAGAWAFQVMACDKDKATAAAASHGTCTAEMAAACTASGAAKTASMDCCASKSAATTAVNRRAGTKGATMTASMAGCTGTAAAMASSDHCAGARSAALAAHGSCAAKGAATASAAGCAGMTTMSNAALAEHCAGMLGAATVASTHGSCSARAKTSAAAFVAGSDGQCSGHAAGASNGLSHADCDACENMILCSGELEAAGTRTQIVPLKNGVMFVYTAEDPGKVSVVQSAMARRSERLNQIVTAGDRARLCPECKSMRGAIASGKMTREVINIEGGALTLMTSNDPAMVKKIRAMADANRLARAKS